MTRVTHRTDVEGSLGVGDRSLPALLVAAGQEANRRVLGEEQGLERQRRVIGSPHVPRELPSPRRESADRSHHRSESVFLV